MTSSKAYSADGAESCIRYCLLTLASGDAHELWDAVTAEPTTKGIGNPAYDPSTDGVAVLDTFQGIERT